VADPHHAGHFLVDFHAGDKVLTIPVDESGHVVGTVVNHAMGADGTLHEIPVPADMTSSVWKYLVEPGASVKSGEPLVILEAMKMEFTILAPCSGVVSAHCCKTGELVSYGVPLLILDTREQVAHE
jgi:biotin carboxyl carrier protein